MKPIYLDYNSTTPVAEEAVEAMLPYLKEHFGNPYCGHYYGIQAKQAVEKARAQAASLLRVKPEAIVFTSGGSESNNLALKGAACALKDKGRHIITSAVEHPAIVEPLKRLQSEGFTVTTIPVDEYGMVDPVDVKKALRKDTILITLMHANNEVGTIEPLAEIGAIARENGAVFHTDAAQSAGKLQVTAEGLGADLISLAGHKFYAPKGVGALFVREGVRLERLIDGAGQDDYRSGTENVPEVVAFGAACELAESELESRAAHMQEMRDRLHSALEAGIRDIRLNGHPQKRLPNTLSVGIAGVRADELITAIPEVACSAGSACHTGNELEMSSVLKAMGVPEEYAFGTIRLSTGRYTTPEEIDRAAEVIIAQVRQLRG